MFLNMVDMYT